jgi:predicted alpha/beta hydrolase family esterase
MGKNKKVFLVHGFKGAPNGGWRPWLMSELGKKDIYACALPMTTPDKPEKDEWVKTIKDAVGVPNEDIFLVGHSLGVPAILRYLETLNKEEMIGGAVLVSGPAFEIKKAGYEMVNTFLSGSFDFKYIQKVCKKFTIIHGDNDTAVPFSDGEYLAENLSCDLIPILNGGHLNGSAGWRELPPLLESLEKMF